MLNVVLLKKVCYRISYKLFIKNKFCNNFVINFCSSFVIYINKKTLKKYNLSIKSINLSKHYIDIHTQYPDVVLKIMPNGSCCSINWFSELGDRGVSEPDELGKYLNTKMIEVNKMERLENKICVDKFQNSDVKIQEINKELDYKNYEESNVNTYECYEKYICTLLLSNKCNYTFIFEHVCNGYYAGWIDLLLVKNKNITIGENNDYDDSDDSDD